MKTFYDVKSAMGWANSVIKKATEEALPIITEQLYKDSDKYTYRDTGNMFESGARFSEFKQGYIIERAPQVRMLYYNPNIIARGNKLAVPQWLEVAAKENISTYKKMYGKILDKNKE
jgi:hypothetical protein